MDLVTLLVACTLIAGPHDASFCRERTPVLTRVLTIADSAGTPSPAANPTSISAIDRWQPFIAEASSRFGIPETWIHAVMRAESGGQTMLDGRPITSFAGAMGLMQVMPNTYGEMRLRHGLGTDPYDPHDNILAGAAYLRAMYDRYGYPGFFAAYNVGPARFDDYLLRGVPLPDVTLQYLHSISPNLHDAVVAERPDATAQPLVGTAKMVLSPSGNTLFFPLGTASVAPVQTSISVTAGHVSSLSFGRSNSVSGGLFVPLAGASHAPGDQP